MKDECVSTITISYLHLMKINLIENVEIVGVASQTLNQVLLYAENIIQYTRIFKSLIL